MFVSHKVIMSGAFDSRTYSHSKKFKQRPQILLRLNLRELCASKLTGLHPFDNMVIL